MVYRFINKNKLEFGLRWICRKLCVSLTSYYNYLKLRKEQTNNRKSKIQKEIKSIYYNTNRNLAHTGMKVFLARKGILLSKTTVFKYINQELGLHAVLKLRKSRYKKSKPDLTY